MTDAAVLATGALRTSILQDVGGDGDDGKVRNSASSSVVMLRSCGLNARLVRNTEAST